jgi:nicotinate-nucleotide adenylyltransferase
MATAEQRLLMLKMALDHPQMKICTLELERKGPSYTIDTIRALLSPNITYRLILSEESAAQFDRWKDFEELAQLAPPLIGPRKMQVSSTEIRERLKKNLYCGHLLPEKVWQYIQKTNLYSFPLKDT